MVTTTGAAAPAVDEGVRGLLARAGLAGPATLHPIGGGGGANNRVCRVEATGCRFVMKEYHDAGPDGRDRLACEFAFAAFAWSHGLRTLPQPIACDTARRLGLFQFIDGRKPTDADVTERSLDQAVAFYRELNRHRHAADAAALTTAAEACFTVNEHLACVDRRIDRLRKDLPPTCAPGVRREAAVFVHSDLGTLWRRVRCGVVLGCTRAGMAIDQRLADGDRRLSPSDFGFHNAIVTPGGQLAFIDFEYAGWDDPAKLVCDFFCQPAVPVPMDFYARLAEVVAADLPDAARHRRRMDLLMPVYRLKWCCILLNEFLDDGRARRRFAGAADDESGLTDQLDKARRALARAEQSSMATMG